MSNSSIAPFVKWAGGKRQLIPQIRERMPEKYNDYYEPFVGGGAVIFELLPEKALINDINRALINAYNQICNAPEAFLEAVKKLDADMWEDGKEYYYFLREHYNDKLMKAEYDVELAALFVFINKHCFNGLYRVNGKGLFNVPYNNSRRTSVDEGSIIEISKYLQGITIIDGDFEEACKDAKRGDFIFIDSPYTFNFVGLMIAYTTTPDEKYEIQYEINLEDFIATQYINNEPITEYDYLKELGSEEKALQSMLQDMEIADFSDFVSIDDNDLKNVLGLERDDDGNIYDPLAQDLDNDGVSDRYDHDFKDSDYFETTYDVDDNVQLKGNKAEKPSILKRIKSYQDNEKESEVKECSTKEHDER